MTKEEKVAIVEELSGKLNETDIFYITDSSTLTVEEVNNLRSECFKNGIELRVIKNTLVKKAMDAVERSYDELYEVLVGPTALMFCATANAPAKVIKAFRKSHEKPILKAAYIDSSIYIGDENLNDLSNLKSKEELIGEVVGLLQSPIKNVIGALQSGGHTISGLLKALEERGGGSEAAAAE